MKLLHLLILLALASWLSSCSQFTHAGRQQRAYEKYVRKSSVIRARQQVKFRQSKIKIPPVPEPSAPVVSAATGPQSVSSGEQP